MLLIVKAVGVGVAQPSPLEGVEVMTEGGAVMVELLEEDLETIADEEKELNTDENDELNANEDDELKADEDDELTTDEDDETTADEETTAGADDDATTRDWETNEFVATKFFPVQIPLV